MYVNWIVILNLILLGVVALGQGCQKFQAAKSADSSSYLNSPFQCSDVSQQSPDNLRRLSKAEYVNTVRGFLGNELFARIEPVVSGLPSDSINRSVSEFQYLIDESRLRMYEKVAESTYSVISSNTDFAKQLAGDCILAATVSESCINQFIAKLGRLAFRRPLSSQEIDNLRTQVYVQGNTPIEGLGWTVYKLLLSPDFLFHFEEGDVNADLSTQKFNLTGYEVASRLSYVLWDAPPDEELYEAAAQNKLSSKEELDRQVTRMLNDERAKTKLKDFFTYYLQPELHSDVVYSAEFLGAVTNLSAINTELEREMYEFIDHIVWEKRGSFEDLLTSKVSFARVPAAAEIYDHAPAADGEAAQMGGERIGLLMRAPILNNGSNETRPILRGVKFRTRFLCDALGLPSGVTIDDANMGLPDDSAIMTTREETAHMTEGPDCIGCHAQINPLGFVFENIDSIGRFREVEKIFSPDGSMIIAEREPDTYVSDLRISPDRSIEGHNGSDLVKKMAASDKAPACFARHLYRFYLLKSEQRSDACRLYDMYYAVSGQVNPDASILDAIKEMIVSRYTFIRQL